MANATYPVVVLNAELMYTIYRGGTMNQKQYIKYRCLGLNIAYYRKEHGLSQSQLAELVNVSRTHMSRIETADCAVSLDVVFDICDVLGVKPSKLFDFRTE